MNISPTAELPALRRRVADLESAGLDVLVVSEGYTFDAPSFLGFLAAITERVELMSGVLSVFARSPTLLATTAAGIDLVSGGRCALGLGASGPQVVEGWHGQPFDRPLARSREVVSICRAVWRGERIEHSGPTLSVPLTPERGGSGVGKALRMTGRARRSDIPIYLAALGPKNVELAAEIADGWLPTLFLPERAGETFGAALRAGRARRSADLGPLEVMVSAPVAVGGTAVTAPVLERARAKVAMFVGGMGSAEHNFYNRLVGRYGFEEAAAAVQRAFLAGDKAAAAAALPAELLAGVTLCGDAGYVRDRLQTYQAAGVTTLKLETGAEDELSVIESLRAMLS